MKRGFPINKQRYTAHARATVDEPSCLGLAKFVGPFCRVMQGVHMGERCRLGQNVVIAYDVVIGKRCTAPLKLDTF